MKPFHESHTITGTFAEYRDTGSSPHFHNGTDIPKADGQPVYAITDSEITSILRNGSNAYVRAGNFAYVHVKPAPDLSVGDSVFAQETVVGTILPGQGHVHLNDGLPGEYKNALRREALSPYEDPWAPAIEIPRFYVKQTRQRLASSELGGQVEITFRVKERNAPPGARGNRRNNGAYEVGFKVLTRDRDSVVYVPGNDGVSFRANRKPSDQHVHNVFDRLQSSTSRHVYIPTNKVQSESSWDASRLTPGDYTVLLFAEDTRNNRTERYIDVTISRQDFAPPPSATLLQAASSGQRVQLRWTRPGVRDLAGYRLYRSETPSGPATLVQEEGVLSADSTRYRTREAQDGAAYFYVAAVDTVPNVSEQGDRYGGGGGRHDLHVLIVDGFDRTTGSWEASYHNFAARHGGAVSTSGVGFTTVANEAVVRDEVDLDNYDAVVWALGDESTDDETFSTAEQTRVKAYLRGGGKLFANGSEIAWDLGNQGGSGDQLFLRKYLKVSFGEDDSGSLSAAGADGGLFERLSLSYGRNPYEENYPDVYVPARGGEAALHYGNGKVAAVQYEGSFDTGETPGKLVTMGFPFETISTEEKRNAVMRRVLAFFFPKALDLESTAETPRRFTVGANYPNPVHTHTAIPVALPRRAQVTLSIYDALGRRVARQRMRLGRGEHVLEWRPKGLANGTYFFRITADGEARSGAMTVMR